LMGTGWYGYRHTLERIHTKKKRILTLEEGLRGSGQRDLCTGSDTCL
jgi:hypothetical protein